MNKRQVKAIWGGVILAVLAVLYAPFNWPESTGPNIVFGGTSHTAATFAGYRFLFTAGSEMVELNVVMLVVELVVVAAITAGAVFALRAVPNSAPPR